MIAQAAQYFVKFGKFIFRSGKPITSKGFKCALPEESLFSLERLRVKSGNPKALLEAGDLLPQTRALIGDASLYTESLLKSQLSGAKEDVFSIFGKLDSVKSTSHRAKGALSIEAKLIKGIQKTDKKAYDSMDEAVKFIEDGIGSRVITKSLGKLKRSEIMKMIEDMTFEGKALSKEQKKLLTDYIYQSKIPAEKQNEAFALFEEFATPLIEKRSQEVVDTLTLGIMKAKNLTVEELRAKGIFREDLLQKYAKHEKDIMPVNITEINNYRGKYGLPEFSNRQIRQLTIALDFKKVDGVPEVKIISDARGLKSRGYSDNKLNELTSDSIKKSGYRTAQVNVVHSNGALGEVQFRGQMTNLIAEFEHIAYDLRQGKNTLGAHCDEFASAIKSLKKNKYKLYNEYLEACYNYYNRLELGLPAKMPKLPKGFDKCLNIRNLKKLHNKTHSIERQQNVGFVREPVSIDIAA